MNEKEVNNQKLPEEFRVYFWDCDFDNLDFNQYKFFVIERLLRYGNDNSIKWLFKNVSEMEIKEVVDKSRDLDPKTKNFWNIYFKTYAIS
ncbi:MAG: hypothetical protein N2319_02815 [Candidatus Kapabacteria bacterium]|nr:hypothetical protein [Candidatus Kapabacteria bacterium]